MECRLFSVSIKASPFQGRLLLYLMEIMTQTEGGAPPAACEDLHEGTWMKKAGKHNQRGGVNVSASG